MILPLLAMVAALLAQPVPVEAPAAPPPPPPPPATLEQVLARIDLQMTPWKTRSGERLRGMLGLSEGTVAATDGEVVFWTRRSEATACGVSASGVIACGQIGGGFCRLGVAFDKEGKVKNWKATGDAPACEKFADDIGAPA